MSTRSQRIPASRRHSRGNEPTNFHTPSIAQIDIAQDRINLFTYKRWWNDVDILHAKGILCRQGRRCGHCVNSMAREHFLIGFKATIEIKRQIPSNQPRLDLKGETIQKIQPIKESCAEGHQRPRFSNLRSARAVRASDHQNTGRAHHRHSVQRYISRGIDVLGDIGRIIFASCRSVR